MKNFFCALFIFIVGEFSYAQQTKDIFEIARGGSLKEAQTAIKQNPKLINSLNSEGYSPLILACYRGNNDVAKFLIENGSDINEISNMGTPLMAAVVKNNGLIVDLLLEKNANINLTDGNGTTALIYAAIFKKYDLARLLIKAGANGEAKDNRGNSAIDYAILADDDKLIEILKTK